jgi:tetratricopeptide (TPR) repeat protein
MVEPLKAKSALRHPVNESLTRPWLKHFFITQSMRDSLSADDTVVRDTNLLDLFKTTIPLADNSFTESTMSSWRMFIDSAFRDSDTSWYGGIRKTLVQERFFTAIEQLELEMPTSNVQRGYQFYDHAYVLRKIPRVPIKLFFALPGNEKVKLIQILRQAISNNPHNIDIALLTYSFFKAWDRTSDFLELAQQENRKDLEEWYHWAEHNMKKLGSIARAVGNVDTAFYIYDRAPLSSSEYTEIAEWYFKQNEFKFAYHFYYKAKEFELALELLQNISTREFAELANMRRISHGERVIDLDGELPHFTTMYQEEMETLRGFARIRAAELYKQVSTKARQHFDRETIETKYAFGELTEEEYQRLIRQLQERKQ